jgi:hypothetical protein
MQKPTVTEIRPTPSTDAQRAWHVRQVRLVRESLLRRPAGDVKR